MNSLDEISAALRKRFKTTAVFLDEEKKISVTVRELTRAERRALNQRLFVTDGKGNPIAVDENDQPSDKGEFMRFREGVDYRRELLLATLSPVGAVDDILSDDVPESVKDEIVNAARAINGTTIKSAAGN